MRRSLITAAALIGGFALAGCGRSGPALVTSPGAALHGRVTAGPTCPVQRADQPCAARPVQASIAVTGPGGRKAATVPTDADGRYAVSLSPGTYTLHVETTGMFPRCGDVEVTVVDGRPTTADIDCDTGIR